MTTSFQKIAILGARRGLGRALAEKALRVSSDHRLFLCSRKVKELSTIAPFSESPQQLLFFEADFTKTDTYEPLLNSLTGFNPTQIFYCAGGGPFGAFSDKPWHAHQWALQLNLIFPATLLHHLLSLKIKGAIALERLIFIGSSIAESKADPFASSYAAAKHGLHGLIRSIIAEDSCSDLDLRLYSPGYMDTGLLPPGARPRLDGSWIADPQKIADDLWDWSQKKTVGDQWHWIPNNR